MTRIGFVRVAFAAAVAVTAGIGLGAAPAAAAAAAAAVSIDSELGGNQVRIDGQTALSVSGSGFQSIQGGFGGIYVLFGWVDDPAGGSWKPSNGGSTGVDYLYVPDTEAKDNQGYQRFVTFPGSGTAAAANGGELAADGTWSLQMRVPGPTFEAVDRDGDVQAVDCREVTCGIITIGAHGVINPSNETFTPVEFVSGSGSGSGTGSTSTSGQSDTADDDATTGATDTQGTDAEASEETEVAAPSGPATIGLEQSTIIVGRVLTFTGTGFTPGEQVVAVLGAGETGAGPLIAGRFGEVAGALTLPSNLRTGTHVLQLVGAGSGQVAEATISVMADPAALTAAEAAGEGLSWPVLAVLIAAAVLLVILVSSLVTGLTRRRRRKRAAKEAPEPEPRSTEQEQRPEPGQQPEPEQRPEPEQQPSDLADTAVIPVRRSARRHEEVRQ